MIRLMQVSDAENIAKVISHAMFDTEQAHPPLKDYPQGLLEQFIQERYTPSAILNRMNAGEQIFVAEKKKEIVGTITIQPKENIIRALFVDPKWQDQGIGTALLKQSEEWCRNHKINIIIIHANVGAVEFYPPFGYKVQERRVDTIGDCSIEEVILTKQLLEAK